MSNGELILYQTEDGLTEINLRAIDGTVWLTQNEIAELFGVERSVITKHLGNIFAQRELDQEAVCAKFAHTAHDSKQYQTKLYNLDAILAVRHSCAFHSSFPRTRESRHSARGNQFQRWANTILGVEMNRQLPKRWRAVWLRDVGVFSKEVALQKMNLCRMVSHEQRRTHPVSDRRRPDRDQPSRH